MDTSKLIFKGAYSIRANAVGTSWHWDTQASRWVENPRVCAQINVGVAPGLFWSRRDTLGEAVDDASARFEIWEWPHPLRIGYWRVGVVGEATPFLLKAHNGAFVSAYSASGVPPGPLGAPSEGNFEPLLFARMPVAAELKEQWDPAIWSALFTLARRPDVPSLADYADLVSYVYVQRDYIDKSLKSRVGGRVYLNSDPNILRPSAPEYFFSFSKAGTQPLTLQPVTPQGSFKFKGKFTLRAEPKLVGEAPLDISLVSGSSPSGGVEDALGTSPDGANSYFTIWEWDQPMKLSLDGNRQLACIAFVLRARNGNYVCAAGVDNKTLAGISPEQAAGLLSGKTLAATVADREFALTFFRIGDWDDTNAFELGVGQFTADRQHIDRVGRVCAMHSSGDQAGSRTFLTLQPPSSNNWSKFTAKQVGDAFGGISVPDCTWMEWPKVKIHGPVADDLSGRNATGPFPVGEATRSWIGGPLFANYDFSHANLSGVVCQGADLAGITTYQTNMSGADLTGSCFGEGATFGGVNFSGATLYLCSLRKANLAKTDLSGADMRRCDLFGADFTAADFRSQADAADQHPCRLDLSNADLRNATFAGLRLTEMRFVDANLAGTDFSRCHLASHDLGAWAEPAPVFSPAPMFSRDPANRTKFSGATVAGVILGLNWSCLDLTDATIVDLPQDLTGLQASHLKAQRLDLSNRNLTNAVFDNADLTGAIFTDSNLTGASFKGAKLYGATFSYATLDNANFTEAQLGTLDVSGTTIRAAVLSGASMRNAVFTDANLDRCVLNEVQWYGTEAKADGATLPGAKIANANLSGINLQLAKLDNVNFAGTILVNADLSGARVPNAAFTDAHLQGAKFKQVTLDDADFTNAAVALDHGVPLFGLAAGVADGYVGDLDAGRISSDLKTAFHDHGYPLLDNPSVTPNTAGTQWTVSNDATKPPPTGLGGIYETFVIFKTESGRLQFYGSTLWVTQEVNGKLQPAKMPCSPTTLPEQAKLSSIVFPSGHKLSEFTNHHLTWEQLMTTREPLTPPKCIPSPGAFCPHPRRPSGS